MNNIPTAEKFLLDFELGDTGKVDIEDAKEALVEFTKLHVQAALKEALESIPCLGSSSDIATYEEVETAVLNAYPSSLIQ